ncbi:PLP-dependent transferase [Nakamurella flava]|uniref:PLP-dependent transferase n=1 Tax=Nakamurella flava TaxID=2576308 RepID=A0A4U6Q6B5_9ACTN|nr:PLP-dependent transferase [Nakamurella flava]TKV56112.1 PLP-dependent transferase [Nakamurella flava]
MADQVRSQDAERSDGWRPDTVAVAAGRPAPEPGAPLNQPLVLASNFRSAPPGETVGEYSRNNGTPGWAALESAVGALEGGRAVAFGSGMAAVAAVTDDLTVGARVVVPVDSYQVVRGLLQDGTEQGRWHVDAVDITDTAAVVAAVDGADLLWLESPSNPLMEVADLPALCAAGRAAGARVAVDNTFATPLLQRPLDLGADVVVHSATKFLGGHSDLLLGVAVARDDAEYARLYRRRVLSGGTPGALEAFLTLRGIRTLAVRVERAQESAGVLAARLAAHPAVERVRYPGLPGDPGHQRAAAQMTGFGAMLSFEVAGGAAAGDAVVAAVRLITAATSLGGVESTIERRAKLAGQEHIPPGLLRLSVGIEHVEDLWADLLAGLDAAAAAR